MSDEPRDDGRGPDDEIPDWMKETQTVAAVDRAGADRTDEATGRAPAADDREEPPRAAGDPEEPPRADAPPEEETEGSAEARDDRGPGGSDRAEAARSPEPPRSEGPRIATPATSGGEDQPSTRETTPSVSANQPSGCVFIGPSQVGKTTLVLAIEKACNLPQRDQPELRFLPLGETPTLIAKAVAIMTRQRTTPLRATQETNEYRFRVQVVDDSTSSNWLELQIEDGPGGALFPTEVNVARMSESLHLFETDMVAKARRASSLVICVDAKKPRSDLWHSYLPRLFAKLVEGNVDGAQLPVLHFERVLLLLNKIDQFGFDAVQELERAREAVLVRAKKEPGRHEPTLASLRNLSGLKPAELVERIDPIGQAKELLGIAVLERIRSALLPRTRFGIGICSAGGFDREGGPFLGADGLPTPMEGELGEEVLRRWSPYGVREALLFLATGESNRTVRLLAREHLFAGQQASELAHSDFG